MVKELLILGLLGLSIAITACVEQQTIRISYSPSGLQKNARTPTPPTKTIRIEAFTDARATDSLVVMSMRGTGPQANRRVESNVGKVVADGVKAELEAQGYHLVEQGGDLLISGEILDLRITSRPGPAGYLSSRSEGGAQIRIIVRQLKANRVVWTETVGGRSKPSENCCDFEKSINAAVADAIKKIVSSPQLHDVLD